MMMKNKSSAGDLETSPHEFATLVNKATMEGPMRSHRSALPRRMAKMRFWESSAMVNGQSPT